MTNRILLIWLGACLVFDNAHCALIDSDKYVRNLVLSDNTTLAPGNIIDADNITIERSLYFINNGYVSGDIYICNYCQLFIQNRGTYNGSIHAQDGATLIRIVTSHDDMTSMDVDGNLNILIKDAHDISLSDILSLNSNIERITIDNSDVILDYTFSDDVHLEFELIGNATLRPSGDMSMNDARLLPNIYGDGSVILDINNSDILHGYETYLGPDGLYVRTVRETDYVKIFDDALGNFLNDLRESNPSDKLIKALDNATNMDEIRHIMSKSIRTNPRIIMNPIKTFNRFARVQANNAPNGINIAPEYTISDNFYINSTTLNLGLNASRNFYIGVAGYTGNMEYSDSLNDYIGKLYGANISLQYNNDIIMLRTIAGTTVAKFETPTIFYNNEIHTNPKGRAVYGGADFGIPFHIAKNINITPFIGTNVERAEILNIRENSITTHAGMDIKYSNKPGDIQYDYGFHITTDTNGATDASVNMSWFSEYDNMGGGLSIGMIKETFATSYKFSLNINMRF